MREHKSIIMAGGFTGAARTARATRRAAAGLACAGVLAASVAACDPTSSDHAPARTPPAAASLSSATASARHACSAALSAVGTYGPGVIKDAIEGHETLDKLEIDLLVALLRGASAATGDPAVKSSITGLANDYLNLRDSLHGKVDAAVEKQVDSGAAHLRQQCESSS
jgi:hypothetical protein